MSSTLAVECTNIHTSKPYGSIRDIKFVDDEALMIAISHECWCFPSFAESSVSRAKLN